MSEKRGLSRISPKIIIRDTGETLTVKNHFNGSNRFAVEEIAFADGGKMGWQQRDWGSSSAIVGSQADDETYDYTGHSVTVQARGNNDHVYLKAGNDQVSAGRSDDNTRLTDKANIMLAGKSRRWWDGDECVNGVWRKAA